MVDDEMTNAAGVGFRVASGPTVPAADAERYLTDYIGRTQSDNTRPIHIARILASKPLEHSIQQVVTDINSVRCMGYQTFTNGQVIVYRLDEEHLPFRIWQYPESASSDDPPEYMASCLHDRHVPLQVAVQIREWMEEHKLGERSGFISINMIPYYRMYPPITGPQGTLQYPCTTVVNDTNFTVLVEGQMQPAPYLKYAATAISLTGRVLCPNMFFTRDAKPIGSDVFNKLRRQ